MSRHYTVTITEYLTADTPQAAAAKFIAGLREVVVICDETGETLDVPVAPGTAEQP
jgi:hypothetical protein